MFRTRRSVSLIFSSVLVLLSLMVATPSHAASDLLPDLGMARLRRLTVDTTTISGKRLLRFTTIIVNVGAGPFEALGSRADTSASTMTVRQKIYNDAGGSRIVSIDDTGFYAGDGHNHWHIKNLEGYQLFDLTTGDKIGTSPKTGFCFFDNVQYRLTLPGAPQSQVYMRSGCGTASSLKTKWGLSVGWGDSYSYVLPDQYIDITGLPDGKYRAKATADPNHYFVESNTTNNVTWTDFQLTGTTIHIMHYGPTA